LAINQYTNSNKGDFLPNLCTVQAVFHLVLVGELLAIALTLMDGGVLGFYWDRLGVLSMLIQWIILCSAGCLCPLRAWFRDRSPTTAGAISYGLVLLITIIFTILGVKIVGGEALDVNVVVTNLVLAAVFAGIVLRYFYLQQQLRNQQKAELTARIQALQARIRPHFLFNSMNSIASLIDIDPKAAEQMVVDLSELFRASLSEPGLIPLERELELCRRFVTIEQTRIGERLTVNWVVEDLESCMVPSLMVQPLVENAIYHGIQPLASGGSVDISVKSVADNCKITVSNPVGDKLQATNKGNGLALENIRHRLHAHYGGKERMEINEAGNVFSIEIEFPKLPNINDDQPSF